MFFSQYGLCENNKSKGFWIGCRENLMFQVIIYEVSPLLDEVIIMQFESKKKLSAGQKLGEHQKAVPMKMQNSHAYKQYIASKGHAFNCKNAKS